MQPTLFKDQPHKMAKHTQTICGLLAGLTLKELISNFFTTQ